ncbi:alpha/beta fold hydrolase [Arthrobacter sp. ISL-72]|uniref:alpha/beta fold hydrolase n=1 Tax=Arthrobacter sp. ISL-72 TaxID=2819114 RepID=UPI001BE6FF1F|nr:alpha/beta hydrolase [Arthrobacter sp. ISL-72]MBT2596141.1 alpha/beta hydrolase [Arthrobacter sp. ISL-72]
MAVITVGDVDMFYEEAGRGPGLVLVHGSWVDHHEWDQMVPLLAKHFRVVSYDRRGHSKSSLTNHQGSVHEDVEDLLALIRLLRLDPAVVMGNSFGALIALRLAAAHPEVIAAIVGHEPPGLWLLAEDLAYSEVLQGFTTHVGDVAEALKAGNNAQGAELFVDSIALGPGSWERLPPDQRETFVRNAPTFLDELGDPDGLSLDLGKLQGYTGPVLLTQGDQSPPMFASILDRLQLALPNAQRVTWAGAGHVPHLTHPHEYAETVIKYAVQDDAAS